MTHDKNSCDQKVKRFAMVTEWMLAISAGLTKNEFRVLCALCLHANEKWECWPSQDTLGDVLGGLSRKKVSSAISGLRSKKVIETVPSGRTLIYRILQGNPDVGEDPAPIPKSGVPKSGTVPQNRGTNRPIRSNYSSNSNSSPTSSTQEELLASEVTPKGDHSAEKLLQVWLEVTGRTIRKPTRRYRTEQLRTAIKKWGFEDAEKAIRGIGLSDFHMGLADPSRYISGSPTVYNDIKNIFPKESEKTERFIRAWEDHLKSKDQQDQEDPEERWSKLFMDFFRSVLSEFPRNIPDGEDLEPIPIGKFIYRGVSFSYFSSEWGNLNTLQMDWAAAKWILLQNPDPEDPFHGFCREKLSTQKMRVKQEVQRLKIYGPNQTQLVEATQ